MQSTVVALPCRSSSEAPQEAVMMQLTGEVAFLHQAYAFCLAMRDTLAAALVRIHPTDSTWVNTCALCWFAYVQ